MNLFQENVHFYPDFIEALKILRTTETETPGVTRAFTRIDQGELQIYRYKTSMYSPKKAKSLFLPTIPKAPRLSSHEERLILPARLPKKIS
jgi:hypothetical protein